MIWLISPILFFVLLVSASGLGRLFRYDSYGNVGVGLLYYLGIYSAWRFLKLPLVFLESMVWVFIMTGSLLALRYQKLGERKILIPIGVTLLGWVLGRIVPFNPHSLDLKHYTMEQAWNFGLPTWIQDNPTLGAAAPYLYNLITASRTASGAFSWIYNEANISIDRGVVMEGCLALLLLSIFQIAVLLRKIQGPVLAKVSLPIFLLSVPAILNPNHMVAILLGGHINQAMGMLALTTLLILLAENSREGQQTLLVRYLPFVACGSVLFLSYPEMCLALPVYLWGSLLLFPNLNRKDFVLSGLAVLLGTLIVSIPRATEVAEFLAGQLAVGIKWAPMVGYANHPFCYLALLSSGGYHKWLLPLLLMGWGIFFMDLWRRKAVSKNGLIFVVGFLTLVSTAIIKSGDAHYISFKLSGWFVPIISLVVLKYWVGRTQDLESNGKLKLTILGFAFAISAVWALRPIAFLIRNGEVPLAQTLVSNPTSPLELEVRDEKDPVYDLEWVRVLAPKNGIKVRTK